jgi:hypothetical protein
MPATTGYGYQALPPGTHTPVQYTPPQPTMNEPPPPYVMSEEPDGPGLCFIEGCTVYRGLLCGMQYKGVYLKEVCAIQL